MASMMVKHCVACNSDYDPVTHSGDCPHVALPADTIVPRIATVAQKVRVVVNSGWWVEFDKTTDFNMQVFVTSIRLSGYLLGERCYIPASSIECIFIYDTSKPPEGGIVLPFPSGKSPA